jgi:hypothetical protein
MSYETGAWLYSIGLAEMLGYAVSNPTNWQGWAILGTSAALRSNPHGIAETGKSWDDLATGHDQITKQMHDMTSAVTEKQWTAQDWDAFEKSVNSFNSTLTASKENHDGVAKSLHGLAALSQHGGELVAAVGTVLAVRAAMNAFPAFRAATAFADPVTARIQPIMQKSLVKYGLATAAAGVLVSTAGTQIWSMRSNLDGKAGTFDGQKKQVKQLDLPLSNLPHKAPGADASGTDGTGTGTSGTGTGTNGTGTGTNGTGTNGGAGIPA